MKQSALRLLSPLPLTLVAAACGGLDPSPPTWAGQAQRPPRSAGNVGLAISADRPPAELAGLRARGPEALVELLARYDELAEGAERAALAATIDAVAGQRYATVSRLYWYTDLADAQAVAARTGKPILSLRMLGRLDEDLSCANSRFFRTILYPDPAVSALLRDSFVLHWSSERPVPRVTIDFGDGRKLERTVTGNSIHYVLNAAGEPIDALPGLYAPMVFRAELEKSVALHTKLAAIADPEARHLALRAHHAARADAAEERWERIAKGPITYDVGARRIVRRPTDAPANVLRGEELENAIALAQRATVAKSYVEVPELAMIDLGPEPALLLADNETWAMIGVELYGATAINPDAPPVPETVTLSVARREPARAGLRILAKPARALIAAVMRRDAEAVAGSAPVDVEQVLAGLERSVIADTAQNEHSLRRAIQHQLAGAFTPVSFAELNAFVYAELFRTPAADPWLGLLPDGVYTGLPGDGVVVGR